jgi:hypothetical protein
LDLQLAALILQNENKVAHAYGVRHVGPLVNLEPWQVPEPVDGVGPLHVQVLIVAIFADWHKHFSDLPGVHHVSEQLLLILGHVDLVIEAAELGEQT